METPAPMGTEAVTPNPVDLRQAISEELNDAICFERHCPVVRMHPKTFAIMDNREPPALGKYTIKLDDSMRVGYFLVE